MDVGLARNMLEMIIKHTYKHEQTTAEGTAEAAPKEKPVLNLHLRFLGMANTSVQEVVDLLEDLKHLLKEQKCRLINLSVKALVDGEQNGDNTAKEATLFQMMDRMQ